MQAGSKIKGLGSLFKLEYLKNVLDKTHTSRMFPEPQFPPTRPGKASDADSLELCSGQKRDERGRTAHPTQTVQGVPWWVSPCHPLYDRTPEGFPVLTNTNDLSQKEGQVAQRNGAGSGFSGGVRVPLGVHVPAQMEPRPTQQVFLGTSPLGHAEIQSEEI